jgi:hypothetical protein
MMLDFLGETAAAARIHEVVHSSDDVTGSTSEIGTQLAERV